MIPIPILPPVLSSWMVGGGFWILSEAELGWGGLSVTVGRPLGLVKGHWKEAAAKCPDRNSISGQQPSFRFKFESQFCHFLAV